jgi:hypothetical protein
MRDSGAERPPRGAVFWAPVVAVALHLGIGFVLFSSSGPDDVHITYGAAANLLRRGSVVNYNGDPIEQSSSLAHVVLTALFSRVTGLSVVTVGHVLPIVAGALCLPVVFRLAERLVPQRPVTTTLFVACIPQFVHWSFGGLEGPLYALASLLAAATGASFLERGSRCWLVLLGLAMTLAAMTRPEGMLVSVLAAGLLVALAARRAQLSSKVTLADVKPELSVLGAAVVAAVVTSGAHFAISGHIFPNPVLAKARGLALEDGIEYLWNNVPWTWWWAVLAFIAGVDAVVGRLREPRASVAAEQMVVVLALAYLAFILASGGDWMWGGRFLANIAPLLGLMIVAGAVRVASATMPALVGAPLSLALLVGNAPAMVTVAGGSRTGRPMWVVPAMRALVAARYPTADFAWFELASGVSLRDIPISESLSDILTRVAPWKTTGPIVVASRQSGFTIFHALERVHPPVHFIDLENLATDDYLPCADPFLTRDSKGALLSPETLVAPPPELTRRCHPVRPDIFFGASHAPDLKAIASNGYIVVFRQRGHVGAEPWSAGHYSNYIAVDAELAQKAKLESTLGDPLDFDWADACSVIFHRIP